MVCFEQVMYNVFMAVTGAIGMVLLGNASVFTHAREECTPLTHAMRYLDKTSQNQLLQLGSLRDQSPRLAHLVHVILENFILLVDLKHKIPKLPPSLEWGCNTAQQYFRLVQDAAVEVDMTVYNLPNYHSDAFFATRANLQSLVRTAHRMAFETYRAGNDAYFRFRANTSRVAAPPLEEEEGRVK